MNQNTTDQQILSLLSRPDGWASAKELYTGERHLYRRGIDVYLFYRWEGPFWRTKCVPKLGYSVDGTAASSTVEGTLPPSAETDFLARYFERASVRIAEVSGIAHEPLGSQP